MCLAAICITQTGCGFSETLLEIRAFNKDGTPLAGLEVTALPFDAQRLFDSLANVAGTERPSFPGLMTELESYRKPGEDQMIQIAAPWRMTRDSVAKLADSLRLVSPKSPGYRAAYNRLGERYRLLAQRAAERDAKLREHMGDDRELAIRAAAAADRIRIWERATYAVFASLADSAVAGAGIDWQRGVTDSSGTLLLKLEPGKWWLTATHQHRSNPFWEDYWNVPIVVRSIGPTVAPLYIENVETRWRH